MAGAGSAHLRSLSVNASAALPLELRAGIWFVWSLAEFRARQSGGDAANGSDVNNRLEYRARCEQDCARCNSACRTENIQRELECTLQSTSASIEGSVL